VSWIQTRRQTLLQWIDERTGITRMWNSFAEEEIPGGSRWAYIFGSGLLFIFIQQLMTGILLVFYYVPSTDHAHSSVAYIQKEVLLGNFIRGLHFYGSSAMVILVVVHLMQTFFWGAYKKKRELLWVVGVVLLMLVLGFSFTGYLLPWDQKAYFGTKVGLSIMSGIPIIGPLLERIVMGGDALTTITLSRFFVMHVLILPLIIIGSIASHILLFRRAGAAGPVNEPSLSNWEAFYPGQVFKDSVFAFLIFILLAALSYYMPAPLEPRADPSDSHYIARPEWYFLSLFQLLKYFPGKLVIVGTVIIPALIFTALFLLPFVDRREERNPFKRPIATAVFSCSILALIALTLLSYRDDRSDPTIKAQLELQTKEAKEFLNIPFKPEVIGQQAKASIPAAPVPALFLEKCAVCHGDTADGGPIGPNLHGVTKKEKRSHDDIIKLLKDPRAYGIDPVMPAFPDFADEQYKEIADWLQSLK
jgi:ubiquinol-cytochrome c reductase cytochrome b subunit